MTWSVYVEEVDQLRPATYVDEPRFGTAGDDTFSDTGPRFAARLELGELIRDALERPIVVSD